MKISQLSETTAGATSSGSVASVSSPVGATQKRAGSLFKGKKTKKKFYESEVSEGEINEDDLILVPGHGKKLKPGFIAKDKDRTDHEVEMARSDLYNAAKNAKQVYDLIKNTSEEEGIEGWVQEKIIKANDYLNTIREYLEHKTFMQEDTDVAYKVSAPRLKNFFNLENPSPDKVAEILDSLEFKQTILNMLSDSNMRNKFKELFVKALDMPPTSFYQSTLGAKKKDSKKETDEGMGVIAGGIAAESSIMKGLATKEQISPVQAMNKSKHADLLNKNKQEYNKKKVEPKTDQEKKKEQGLHLIADAVEEDCWSTHKQVGMKKKGGKMVPNCVPKESVEEDTTNEDLRKWFKEKWVRFGPDGKIRGDCARGDDSEGKPKCLPQSKAHSLGKKGRASAAARKRREDPNPERRGKAKNVATKKKSNEGIKEGSINAAQALRDFNAMAKVKDKLTYNGIKEAGHADKIQNAISACSAFVNHFKNNKDLNSAKIFDTLRSELIAFKNGDITTLYHLIQRGSLDKINFQADVAEAKAQKCPECGGEMVSEELMNEKKDACYHKVKARYKVWPSAYASGALVKCRKKGASNWGKSKTKESSIIKGMAEALADPEANRVIKNILTQNPKGSAAEKILLDRFMSTPMGQELYGQDWIDQCASWLEKNKEKIQEKFPELDLSDVVSLAEKMYEDLLAKSGQLEEDVKSDFDDMIEKMIKDIWGAEAEKKAMKGPRYLVYSQNTGLELDTNSLDDAVFSAGLISKKNLDSPTLVYDRKTKFPVVAYMGSEDYWYQTNPNSPRLHEGYSAGAVGGAGLGEGNPVNVWTSKGSMGSRNPIAPDLLASELPVDIIGEPDRYISQKLYYDIGRGRAARDLFYNTSVDRASIEPELKKLAKKAKLQQEANGLWVYDVYSPTTYGIKNHIAYLEYNFGKPVKKERLAKKTKTPDITSEDNMINEREPQSAGGMGQSYRWFRPKVSGT